MEAADSRLQNLEGNLLCPICQDYFKQAITLNCTHSFCYDCINSWRKTRNECPVCRLRIESLTASLALDNLVSAYTNQEKVETKIIVENGGTNMNPMIGAGDAFEGEEDEEEEEEDDWNETTSEESDHGSVDFNSDSFDDGEEQSEEDFGETYSSSSRSSASPVSLSINSEDDAESYDIVDIDNSDEFDDEEEEEESYD